MKKYCLLFVVMSLMLGCAASVDVTKTAKGFYNPTDPNEVEILMTGTDKPYVELGTVTVTGFAADETATMHNAIRAKAAELGANAVILKDQGMVRGAFRVMKMWAIGAAIRYKENVK